MLNGIQNVISNPTFYNMTQSTATQMSIKTGLNSVARPGFILIDRNIDPHTKKFSATKEFLYQALSLAMYMGIIIPVFKKGTYKLAQKYFKDATVLKAFNSPDEFKAFKKLQNEQEKITKLAELSKKFITNPQDFKAFKKLSAEELAKETAKLQKQSKSTDVFTRENISSDSEDLANGVVEASSLLGTVIGLAIIAPFTATKLIHPILKACGVVKDEQPANVKNDQPQEIKNDNEVDSKKDDDDDD